MRILFLLTQDLQSPSGLGRHFPLAKSLAARGHQVHIAALHGDFDHLSIKEFTEQGVSVQYVAQMHVRKTGNEKTYFSSWGLIWRALQATWRLSQAARQHPADIIHVFKPHPMNSIAGLAGKLGRHSRLFLDCDDREAGGHFTGSWQRRGVEFFENWMPRWVDHITTHNSDLENFLLGLGVPQSKITYLPNGVDFQRFGSLDPEIVNHLRNQLGLNDIRVVAFIGTLGLVSHPVDLLMKAFVSVHDQLPDSRLLIVGGGEDIQKLHEMATKLGIQGEVLFTGRVAPDQIPAYYRLAEAVVDPVYDNPVGRSRLPLKLFESWAMKIPFITGDVGDRRRVMGTPPAGILVPPGDPEALAQGILQVLTQPGLAEAITKLGTERAPEYDWNELAKIVETAYQNSLAASIQHPNN